MLPPAASRRARLRDLLGLRRSIVGLLAMVVLVGLGERLAERFLPLYLIALGGGVLSVGLLNGLDNFLSAVYSFFGGAIADRLGVKRSLLLFDLLAMAGYLLVILVPRWEAVLLGAFLFISWSALSLPATMSLVARSLPVTQQVMGVSVHSLTRRIPMALGPILGGLAVDAFGVERGVRVAFGGALLLAAVAAVVQTRLIEADPAASVGLVATGRFGDPRALWQRLPGSLKRLLLADILVRFCEQIPYAFVVLWCMRVIADPVTATQFGVLTTVEMATALLVYLPVAWFADRAHKKPFVVTTFVFFTLFPLVLLACRSFWPLAGAFVLRGLKEFGEPTRKALILELAPEDRKAATFGLYYLVRDLVVSIAAFSGAALWAVSPAVNLLTATVCGALGTGWFAWQGRDVDAVGRTSRHSRP